MNWPLIRQGMMLRVDQLQKKRLLMLILLEATMKNEVAAELKRREENYDEEFDEDDQEDYDEAEKQAERNFQKSQVAEL